MADKSQDKEQMLSPLVEASRNEKNSNLRKPPELRSLEKSPLGRKTTTSDGILLALSEHATKFKDVPVPYTGAAQSIQNLNVSDFLVHI
jgi:hypothetical protein